MFVTQRDIDLQDTTTGTVSMVAKESMVDMITGTETGIGNVMNLAVMTVTMIVMQAVVDEMATKTILEDATTMIEDGTVDLAMRSLVV